MQQGSLPCGIRPTGSILAELEYLSPLMGPPGCVLVVWFCGWLLIVVMHWGLRLALSCQSAHRQCYIVLLITHACGLLPILGSLWLHSLHGHCFCLWRPSGWWVQFPHPAVLVTLSRGQLALRSAEDQSKALSGAERPLQWGEASVGCSLHRRRGPIEGVKGA